MLRLGPNLRYTFGYIYWSVMVKKSIASKYKHFDYVVCPNNLFLKFSNELIINV